MKTINKTAFLLTAAALTAAVPAQAVGGYFTEADVVEVRPIIETVYEPVEICHYEYRSKKQGVSSTTSDKVIGGIIGGAAGSAVGKGSGRDAAAAVGAILGGEVAAQDGELTSGELIGGIAGGLLGNQLGGGSGKTAATAAGAVIGSIVGDNLQNGGQVAKPGVVKEKVRVCDIEEQSKKVITGYEVDLEYDDRVFQEVVSKRPGDTVEIYVDISIVEDARTSQLD